MEHPAILNQPFEKIIWKNKSPNEQLNNDNEIIQQDSSIYMLDNYNMMNQFNEIMFTSDINPSSINFLLRIISSISNLEELQRPKSIILYIDSPGGNLKDCFKFIDYILIWKKKYNIKLITVALGSIASAATLMHIIGDEKYITKNTECLIHELSFDTSGKYTECIGEFKYMTDINNNLINIYLDYNKKITRDKLELLLKNSTWFTSKEYIDAGFADNYLDIKYIL